MNIDWSKAPYGATHYLATDKNPWRMVHEDGARFAYIDNEWIVITNPVPFTEYISRPTAPNWSGGHVDASPSYPMGEQASDYAVSPWNGEGLPPVGTVCKLRTVRTPDCTFEGWGKAEILYSSRNVVVWRWHGHKIEFCADWEGVEFHPIRTPEQIAAEEREKAIDVMVADIGGYLNHSHTLAAILYDAGYRKTEG